jgi:16S rRNA (cytosine1402-N4)-methyltransferase
VHIPVLPDEVLRLLEPERGGLFVDCTVGLGGHARLLLEHGTSRLIGLDRDRSALAIAHETLAGWSERVELIHADYRQLASLLNQRGIDRIDGALVDLGVSSLQLDTEGRGFSFRRDEPLDMRMDQSRGETAAERLAHVDEKELADVIYAYGEERDSRRIARALVNARAVKPLETTGQVAEIVRRASRSKGWQRIDPATRTFQALRIWVNGELEGLAAFLEHTAERLSAGRRMAVIAFQSLEDRIVKNTFRQLQQREPVVARVLTKRPVVASESEISRNPRARSAKLRAVERA